MAFEGQPAYAFSPEGVRQGAPEVSGVYAIYTPTKWIFIGDSDNLRQALFDCLNNPDACIEARRPLSFSCELASPSQRCALRDALIEELQSACNPSGEVHCSIVSDAAVQ